MTVFVVAAIMPWAEAEVLGVFAAEAPAKECCEDLEELAHGAGDWQPNVAGEGWQMKLRGAGWLVVTPFEVEE